MSEPEDGARSEGPGEASGRTRDRDRAPSGIQFRTHGARFPEGRGGERVRARMRLAAPCSSVFFRYTGGMHIQLLVTLTLLVALGCSTPRSEALAPAPVGTLANLQACGDLYMGGQPSESDLETLAGRGVRRVINLRKDGEFQDYDERARAQALGLEYVSLQFSTPEELTDEVLARSRELLSQAGRTSTLLHCGSGGRVGALWLAYRTLDEGVAWEKAQAEAQAVGLKNPAYTERIRAYVDAQRR